MSAFLGPLTEQQTNKPTIPFYSFAFSVASNGLMDQPSNFSLFLTNRQSVGLTVESLNYPSVHQSGSFGHFWKLAREISNHQELRYYAILGEH